jgi:hypothetical protein
MGDSFGGIESCFMAKRRIRAKEAVAAIRAGMDDSALMKEYGLAPSGLQSLFDKLITSGYLDLAEIQARMPGFMGTVNIDDPFFPAKEDGTPNTSQSKTGRTGAWINAQEAARDIRAGLDDSALMEKYHLTSRGLRSMVDKLVGVGLITQADLDRRRFGLQENTVALSEEMLGLTDVFAYLGQMTPKKMVQTEPSEPDPIIEVAKKEPSPDKGAEMSTLKEQAPPQVESPSHDNAPKSNLSSKSNALIIAACISLVIVSLVLVSEWLDWAWFPGF